jgi:hypothetical protein
VSVAIKYTAISGLRFSGLNGFADGLLLRLKERMDAEVQIAAYVDRWL